jgi:lipopolysaccharide cholinephosphotransferase
MNPVSMEQQRDVMMSMLTYLDSVCVENNIQYSLGGGTLLGAARHQGFIPWDDDIDIMLMRSQYDKLIQVLKAEVAEPYRLVDVTDKGNPYAFAKICDFRTFCRGPLTEVPEMGIYIDIFPMDYLPDDERERQQFLRETKQEQLDLNFYSLRMYNRARSYSKKIAKSVLYLPKCLYYCATKSEARDKAQLVSKMSSYSGTGTVGFTGSPYSPDKEFYPAELFSSYVHLQFEDQKFSAIVGYKEYLSHLYGDYMKLPPVESRVNHSYYKWYWRA